MAQEPSGIVDRVPPHNIEAEESVLGSMILSHSAVGVAHDMLQPEDFYKDSHRKIFGTLIELHSRGSITDPVILAEELKKKGMLINKDIPSRWRQ